MKNKNQIYVSLIDDHVLLREALAKLIMSFDNIRLSSSLGNGQELIDSFNNFPKPDIIILDLNMPILDGYLTAEWLHKHHPEIKILILTMYDSEIALIRLLQRGVRGFLKKDIHPSDLQNALISVSDNGYYYSHETTGKLASIFYRQHQENGSIDRSLLTEIEIDFLKFACSDLTYKEIAEKMNISPRTIDAYRDSLFDKLQIKNRVGLALYAIKNGVVTF